MSAAGEGGGEGAGAGGRRWETELPGAEDLTPVSTTLISRTLARAFRIPPPAEEDVARASNSMLQLLRRRGLSPPRFDGPSIDPYEARARGVGGGEGGAMPTGAEGAARGGGAVLDRSRKLADAESEDVDSADGIDSGAARTLKRPRLVWTSQLHKRFVDAVGHLGIKNAVPKTIMQLMNVEGLTRENVASHLQKYRLYLKRMQGQSADGDSASDPLFASTPVPLNPTPQHLLPAPQHSRARASENPGPFSAPLPQHFLSAPQHPRARENEILLPFSAPQAQHFLSAPQYSRARENENFGPFPVPVPRAQGILQEQSEAARAMAAAHGGAVHHFNKHNLQNLQQSYSFGVPQRAAGNLPRDLPGNAQSGQPDQSSPSHRELTLFPPSGR